MGRLFVVFPVRLRISLYWLFPLSLVHVRLICLLSAVSAVAASLVDRSGRDYRQGKHGRAREIIEKVAVAMAVIVGFRTLGYARLPALLEPGTVLLSGLHHVSK